MVGEPAIAFPPVLFAHPALVRLSTVSTGTYEKQEAIKPVAEPVGSLAGSRYTEGF